MVKSALSMAVHPALGSGEFLPGRKGASGLVHGSPPDLDVARQRRVDATTNSISCSQSVYASCGRVLPLYLMIAR
jgi:hypothetical protein